MNVGDIVWRIEARKVTRAVVLAVDGDSVLIVYDEGGEGWWPMGALTSVAPE